MYIGGNHALTVIHNAVSKTGRSIAILKDSYAHSIAPCLATKFDNLYLIDMRYYNDDIIKRIKEANPGATIYIQSILPVERSQENRKIYKSTIQECNAALCRLAEESECYYLDVYSAIADGNGYLRDGAAADGVHFAKTEHEKWDAYLLTHAINLGAIKEAQAFKLYTGGGSADIEGFASEMLSSIEFKDTMSEVSDNVAARMFHLEADSLVAGKVYTDGGSTAEEFAVFETSGPDEAEALGEKLRERVEEKKANFETYKPEEMPKLNDPVIMTGGNIAVLCISDDNAAANRIMSKYFSLADLAAF